MTLFIDFETCSTADLKRVGAYKYAADPTTQIILLAYAFDSGAVKAWWPGEEQMPRDLQDCLKNRTNLTMTVAHNMEFDRQIWNNKIIWKKLKLEWTECTMIQCAVNGYPFGLDDASVALGYAGKDKAGHALMKRMSRPREMTPMGPVWWHETDQIKCSQLADYAKRDVELCRRIYQNLPKLNDEQTEEWYHMVRMNERGMPIDLGRVGFLTAKSDTMTDVLDKFMSAQTQGEVPTTRAVKKLIDWVNREEGWNITSVAKAELDGHITAAKDPDVIKALGYRQEAAKTSVAKLKRMKDAAVFGRVHGVFQHYGAARTGRVAGRLIQPQNFPKPSMSIADVERYLTNVKSGHALCDLSFISTALRSCIAPLDRDDRLVVYDFAQIEARVLAWLAQQLDVLNLFAKGDDVYMYAATNVGSPDRQLGKVLTLACGFGMGGKKFWETAATYGLRISGEAADDYVTMWRRANSDIVAFWHSTEKLFREVMKGNIVPAYGWTLGKLSIEKGPDGAVEITLPSGRVLTYQDVRISQSDRISYAGVDQYTRKWDRIETYGGKLVENIVQATARDLLYWLQMEVEKHNLPLIATIHDEIVVEIADFAAPSALQTIEDLVQNDLPRWADGLPVAGEGFITYRYGK